MKILVAEDERITRRSLQKQLEAWGHSVVAAEDGSEAWEEFQRQQFDIVVTDWEMPRMDGRELIQCIRDNSSSSYTYLIMLTGRSETADLVAGMDAGADDFLAKPFDRGELRVRLHAGERIIQLERNLASRNKELSSANAKMKRDLDAAADMQRDLLPTELPDDLGARFAWHFEPCDELGGDILNVLPLDGRYVAMYLLDVTGHGVPAALLSVTLSRVLTTRDPGSSILVTQGESADIQVVTPPHEVAQRLNRQFPMEAQGDKFFTMAYAVFDTQDKLLRYANAGHPFPILVRRECSPRELSGCGLPIGVLDEETYDETSVQLEPGDRVYFFSDGITEAFNEQGKMLETDGLIQLIERARTRPLNDALATCVEELKRWCDPVPLGDDLSLLVLELPDA